jgi:kinesin family protein 2/24
MKNVVKGDERRNYNRKAQLQRQAKLKKEEAIFMSIYVYNPDWEFLAMIKDYRIFFNYC